MYKTFLVHWVDNGTYKVTKINTSIYNLISMLSGFGVYNVDSIIKIKVVPIES